MLKRIGSFRIGIAARLAIFIGVMLFALISVILAIVLKQQRSTLSELAEREILRFLTPVEALTLEIDHTAQGLIRLERFRLRVRARQAAIDRAKRAGKFKAGSYYSRSFDEKQLKAAENNLRGNLRPSQKSDPVTAGRFTGFQRQAAYFARLPEGSTKNVGQRMWNFERDLRRTVDYEQRIDIAFSGLDLDRYRAESIDRFRRPRFDTARLLSRLERQKPAPINAFVWRDVPALHEAILEVYERFTDRRPMAEPSRREFSTSSYAARPDSSAAQGDQAQSAADYSVITRTQFRAPAISERALLLKRALAESGIWRQYSFQERAIITRLKAQAEIMDTRLAVISQPQRDPESGREIAPVPPLRDVEFRDALSEYRAALDDRQALVHRFRQELYKKTDPEHASDLEQLDEAIRELREVEGVTSENAESDSESATRKERRGELQKRIGELRARIAERDFSAQEQIADAFEYIREAALYRHAMLSYAPDAADYDNYRKFANVRKLQTYRWRNLREWVLKPRSETYLNPRLVGWALLTTTRTELQTEMVRLDTTPIDELVDELLYANTVGFTRILVDQTEIRERIRAERDSFLDTTLSIGLRSIFLAFLFSGLLVGAIRRISAGAQKVGQGDLNVNFDYSGRDEIGDLTDSLNGMVRGLKEREELRGELQAAEEIQKRLIADTLPAGMEDQLSFGMFYKAMSGVGGDYYDFITAGPGRFVFCVADVSNHGVGPAIVMTLMRSQLHSIVRRGETDPMKIVLELNDSSYADTPENIFITLFLGVYNSADHSIEYVSAGHNPAYIYRYKSEELETVPAGGMPIGAVDNELFASIVERQTARLNQGDLFFQYTDGVNEAMTEDDVLFGTNRMEHVLRTLGRKKPEAIVRTLAQAVERFTGRQIFCEGPSELNDDIAMIAFRRLK